jgi:3-hydroxyacyl-[acyl-carrier-protein] dehydratase
MISYNEIQSLLKQKTPFIFVDKVIDHDKGKRIVSLKNVTGSEMFSALHFPDNPVYPGIFIIESIAQTTAILCSLAMEENENNEIQFLALGGLQRFNFYKPVRPGDTLRIEVEAIKLLQRMAIVKATVKVDDTMVAEGQMTFGAVKDE